MDAPPVAPALAALGWDDAFATAFAGLGLPDGGRTGSRRVRAPRRLPRRNARRANGRQSFRAGSGSTPRSGPTCRRSATGSRFPGASRPGGRAAPDDVRRRDPDPRVGDQVLAANVDVAFLVTSLNRDFNLRRLERYLTMAWSSGAQPVVILSKADLVFDLDDRLEQVRRVAIGVPIVTVSVPLGLGIEEVRGLLAPGATAVVPGLIGRGQVHAHQCAGW